jgi:hypothetical protein
MTMLEVLAAVPTLLDHIGLAGAVITADAMGPAYAGAYVCWSAARALFRSSVAITIFTRPNVV